MTIELDPNDEFERVLIDIVKHQREKRKSYGSAEDYLWNFYKIADLTPVSELVACEVLMAKHQSALVKWHHDNPGPSPASDDAYIDRAVYGILALNLYNRLKEDLRNAGD